MKIVRIIARLNIGGPSIHISNLSRLHSKGHTTILIYGATSPGEGDMSYLLNGLGLKTYFVPELGREISPLKDLKTFYKILRIIIKERPDIVHTHTAKAGMVGRAAAWLAGVKQIYHTFHGHVFHGYFSPLKTRFFTIVEYMLSLVSTKIITLNEQQRDEIAAITKISKKKFTIIPLGFDLSALTALKPIVKEQLRPLRIGIVGRLTKIKNHVLFIEILKLLQKNGTPFLASIIGDGELRGELEELIKQNGLDSQVIFRGWITDTSEIYSTIDYLFLTSLNEGTPVAVIEAMAAHRIVVSTPAGGVVNIIEHGENGFLSRDFTASSFVEAFEKSTMLDSHNIKVLLEKAAESAQQFSLTTLLNNINNLYNG